MIVSFGDADTRDLFGSQGALRWKNIERVAIRRLYMLNRAASLDDLRHPPGNRLQPLHGDRSGQHSIRINDQFRVCFVWRDGHAHGVQIVDYH